MKVFEELSEDTLVLYAARHYYNPTASSADDFYEDFNRIKYIKRLINKYLESGKLSERLILNHVIVFYNVFGISAANKILEYKLTNSQWVVIKPFLIYLKYIKNNQYVEYEMDKNVIDKLREI